MVGILLSVALILNTALSTYVLYTTSFHASMAPESGESLEVSLKTDTGRISPLAQILRMITNWKSSYFVGGLEAINATTGLTISVTGTNVGSTASVDYYIEAKETGESGQAYRFLEGTGVSVSVGGASLDLDNQTTIEDHLTAMGLSNTASWTIDYYVYVKAECTGAVSGETLTSEITYTKFDTVTYQYPTLVQTDVVAYQDTYVREDYPDTDYSSETGLYQWRKDPPIYQTDKHSIPYFSFNLTDYNDIQKAQLWYWIYNHDPNHNYIEPRLRSHEAWSSPITWNTQPTRLDTLCQDRSFSAYQYPMWIYLPKDVWDTTYAPTCSNNWAYYSVWEEDYTWTWFTSTENADTDHHPFLRIVYVGYEASWYNIPPLSVTELPVSKDLAAVIAVCIAAIVSVKIKMEEHKK